VAFVHPENIRSRCVLEKVGMRETGKARYGDEDLACYEICLLRRICGSAEWILGVKEERSELASE